MPEWINRREFLRFSMATSTFLMAMEATQMGENVQERLKITEADRVMVWVLADNYYDSLRPDSTIAKRYRVGPGRSIHAEHGLAYYVETVVNGETSACMFDYGLDPIGVINNMALLGIDLGKVGAFCLSHGHFDHWMGAVGILKRNQPRIAAGTPFYVGNEAFARRYGLSPGATEIRDLGQLKREDVEAIGLKVVEVRNPAQIIPGAYITGNIERSIAYEKVPPSLLIQRGEKPEPDDFRGEQALFFNVKGKGLVVLSGCAHAGIVNTTKHARKVAGTDRIHAILGGFHLVGANPEIIQNTVDDIRAMKPDFIVPAHCTGFEATVAFQKEMPDEFTLSTAGTEYTFAS